MPEPTTFTYNVPSADSSTGWASVIQEAGQQQQAAGQQEQQRQQQEAAEREQERQEQDAAQREQQRQQQEADQREQQRQQQEVAQRERERQQQEAERQQEYWRQEAQREQERWQQQQQRQKAIREATGHAEKAARDHFGGELTSLEGHVPAAAASEGDAARPEISIPSGYSVTIADGRTQVFDDRGRLVMDVPSDTPVLQVQSSPAAMITADSHGDVLSPGLSSADRFTEHVEITDNYDGTETVREFDKSGKTVHEQVRARTSVSEITDNGDRTETLVERDSSGKQVHEEVRPRTTTWQRVTVRHDPGGDNYAAKASDGKWAVSGPLASDVCLCNGVDAGWGPGGPVEPGRSIQFKGDGEGNAYVSYSHWCPVHNTMNIVENEPVPGSAPYAQFLMRAAGINP